MQNCKISIRDKETETVEMTVTVRSRRHYPEEVLRMLNQHLARAISDWQDRVIAWEKTEQGQRVSKKFLLLLRQSEQEDE